jgi:Cu+-exporting ATPase
LILFFYGSGFFDSLTGLIFFMLLERCQIKPIVSEFRKDFKSYFPIAITELVTLRRKVFPVYDIEKRSTTHQEPGIDSG